MTMATYKGRDINTKPTDEMAEEARRGLDWRKEHGRGGTLVGVARARDISNRKELSISTVKRMYSFFSRHEVDKQAEGFSSGEEGYPSAGRIAWALWGGDAGFAFARRVRESIDSADEEADRAALSGSVKKGLEKKVKDHNEEVGDAESKRTNLRTLSAVFRRGVGAYKTNPGSVRPTVKSPEQWAYARVNSFLYVLRNGKFRSGKHDTDLLPKGHPLSSDDRGFDSDCDNKWSDTMDKTMENQPLIDESEEITMDSERHIKNVEETDDSYIVEYAKAEIEEPEEAAEEVAEEAEEVVEENSYDDRSEESSMTRAMAMEMAPVDEDKRTVRMAISSEEPVMRSFGMEVLEHSDEAIDLSFLKSGRAPLLLDHDPEKQVGIIESVSLDDSARRLRATVRFGKGALAREAFDDVTDGIKANVSIGYSVQKMERKDKDTYVVKKFRIHEASLVSIPADVTVGVGRSSEPSQQPVIVTDNAKEQIMSEVDVQAVEAQARQAAQKNAAQIVELGSRHNKSEMAQRAISEGVSIEEFRGQLLEEIGSIAAVEDQEIGLSRKEVGKFSMLRAIHALANPTDRRAQEAAAFEFEASRAAAQQYGVTAQGIMLPAEVLRNWKRDMSAGSDGDLVAEDFKGEEFIDALRNASSVMQAGARMLGGLSGDVKIPKKTAASTAAFVASEGTAAAESEMTIGNVSMSPKTLGAFTDVTRQLLIQSSLDVEALIRDDLAQSIATAIDKAGLEGSGSSGNPEGILNTTGVNQVTNFAAANPTFAEVVTLETAVAEDNALMGNLSYILPASMYGALKTTEKATNTAQFVVEPGGTINGYQGIVSNQATAGNLYFGNFSDLLIGMFGGLDIVVDPYSNSTSGTVRVVALQSVDVAVRHAVSFAFGNDG
jgi:HK97 family phage major capsid protein/HK97 family phage prohead protease